MALKVVPEKVSPIVKGIMNGVKVIDPQILFKADHLTDPVFRARKTANCSYVRPGQYPPSSRAAQ